jgi:hypothetical protein
VAIQRISFPVAGYLRLENCAFWSTNTSRAFVATLSALLSVPSWAITVPFPPATAGGATVVPLRVRAAR